MLSITFLNTSNLVEEEFNELISLLSKEEKIRSNQFVNRADKNLYVAAHALKRFFIGLKLDINIPIQNIEFSVTDSGKPIFKEAIGIDFNLSHCKDMVACVISDLGNVGVDIERTTNDRSVLINNPVFTEAEIKHLKGLPVDCRRYCFYKYWTMKEAVCKANGSGLNLYFGKSDIRLHLNESGNFTVSDYESKWLTFQQNILDEYILSIAIQTKTCDIEPLITETQKRDIIA